MNGQHILSSRLKKEIMNLDRDPPPGVSCYPIEDDVTNLEAFIKGPPDSPYEYGLFKLQVKIPQSYPFDPPQIRFLTFIYHPNIDDAGRICANILKKGEKGGWKPALNLSTTLLSLSQLLAHPNPDDPLDAEIAKEYQLDYPTFKQKAIEFTKKYANKDQVLSNHSDSQDNPMNATTAQINDHYNTITTRKPKLSLSRKKGLSSQSSQSTNISSSYAAYDSQIISETAKDLENKIISIESSQQQMDTQLLSPSMLSTQDVIIPSAQKYVEDAYEATLSTQRYEEGEDADEVIPSAQKYVEDAYESTQRYVEDDTDEVIPSAQKYVEEEDGYKVTPSAYLEEKDTDETIPSEETILSTQRYIEGEDTDEVIPSAQKHIEKDVYDTIPSTQKDNKDADGIVHPTIVIEEYQRRDLKRTFDQTCIQQQNVILLSDDEEQLFNNDDDIIFTLQLSKKKNRKKLSLQKRKK